MQYGDSLYLKTCKDLSGYEFPADNWSGATLLLLVEDGVNLIKRASTMPTHADQIGCFGGRRAKGENDPVEVAKREFNEETGISSDLCEFVGLLPPVYAARKTIIIPSVAKFKGSIKEFNNSVKSNGEWAVSYTHLTLPTKA